MTMEDMDDDFDDLYADVEMQANTAINYVSKNKETCDDGDGGSDYESDSEDELNIVLSDDDGERGNGAKGQYEYTRPSGVPSQSSLSVRGDHGDVDGCNQRNFTLPRHRTIMDVNIDTFEQKRWKNAGADVTVFFNYGFDEESWKRYCSGLEKIQNQKSSSTKKSTSGFQRPGREKNDNERGTYKAVPEKEGRIEDNVPERCLDDRDSDLIQIVPQDQDSASAKDESTCETSFGHEESEKDDISGNGDEISADFEKNAKGSLRNSPKRFARLINSSNTVFADLDNHLNGQICNTYYHPKATASSSSKENSENYGNLINSKKRTDKEASIRSQLIGEKTQRDRDLSKSRYRKEYSRRSRSPCQNDPKQPNYDHESFYTNMGPCFYDKDAKNSMDYYRKMFSSNKPQSNHQRYRDDEPFNEQRSSRDYVSRSSSFSNRDRRSQGRRRDDFRFDRNRNDRNCSDGEYENGWSMPNEYEFYRFLTNCLRKSQNGFRGNRGKNNWSFRDNQRRGCYNRQGRHERFMSRERNNRGNNNRDFRYRNRERTNNNNYQRRHFDNGRRNWQSSRHEFFDDVARFSTGGDSNTRFDAKRKMIDDGELQHRSRMRRTREGFSGNSIEKSPNNNAFDRGDCAKTYVSDEDSVDMRSATREVKSSKADNKKGGSDRHEDNNIKGEIDKEQIFGQDYDMEYANFGIHPNEDEWLDDFPIAYPKGDLEVEEGQILTEVNEAPICDDFDFEKLSEFFNGEKKIGCDDGMGCDVGEDQDNGWIFEVMAKMEQQRELFKEPNFTKNEDENVSNR